VGDPQARISRFLEAYFIKYFIKYRLYRVFFANLCEIPTIFNWDNINILAKSLRIKKKFIIMSLQLGRLQHPILRLKQQEDFPTQIFFMNS